MTFSTLAARSLPCGTVVLGFLCFFSIAWRFAGHGLLIMKGGNGRERICFDTKWKLVVIFFVREEGEERKRAGKEYREEGRTSCGDMLVGFYSCTSTASSPIFFFLLLSLFVRFDLHELTRRLFCFFPRDLNFFLQIPHRWGGGGVGGKERYDCGVFQF